MTKSAEPPQVLTVEQAAELLQLSGKTLKRLAQAGRIPARRVGHQWRFSRAALMDWLTGKEGHPGGEHSR